MFKNVVLSCLLKKWFINLCYHVQCCLNIKKSNLSTIFKVINLF